jgi:ABC-type transporter Mla subunit MlaD
MAGPIDDALDNLQTCAGDVNRTRTTAAGALDKTRTAQQRAAQSGFLGVARHLDRPVHTLEGHLTQLAEVAATLDTAAAQVAEITTDLTPDEATTRLGAAKGTLTAATDQTSAALSTCTATRDQIATALRGGNPRHITAILEDERRTLIGVLAALGTAATACDTATATAYHIGDD